MPFSIHGSEYQSVTSGTKGRRRRLQAELEILRAAETAGIEIGPTWDGRTIPITVGDQALGWLQVAQCMVAAAHYTHDEGAAALAAGLESALIATEGTFVPVCAARRFWGGRASRQLLDLHHRVIRIQGRIGWIAMRLKVAYTNAQEAYRGVGVVQLNDANFTVRVYNECFVDIADRDDIAGAAAMVTRYYQKYVEWAR